MLSWVRVQALCARRFKTAFVVVGISLALSGCETLNPITVGFGLASYAATGKGLADHAIGTWTQSDCNILGGILSPDRKICEPHGSPATNGEFRGLFVSYADAEPNLRLSERPIEPTPAVHKMQFAESPTSPSLRLSEEIVVITPQPSERLATRERVETASANL